MDVADLVRAHYSGDDLEGVILAALADAGVDVGRLSAADLAPVDQLHAGFAPATAYLLASLGLGPDTRLLDVGCGLGGPARLAAATYACPVVGIDLTPDFVAAARGLSERVGLAGPEGLLTFEVARGDELPFGDAAFDRATLIHVGMNIEDKRAVFADVRRVLRPGGLFGLYEQARGAPGELTYPLPWAEDARSSFVVTVDEYVDLLTATGFAVDSVEDRTAASAGGPPAGLPVTPAVVFGPAFVERVGHNVAATRAGLLSAVQIVARAV